MNSPASWFCKIFIAPVVKKLFIKEINGLENIPKGNFILASNHLSHLDWIADGCLCVPKKFTFIGQVDRFTGFTGLMRDLLYFVSEVIPLDRNAESSKKEAMEKAVKFLKNGYVLIIYPEGTRSRTGQIGKGKWGVAKIFLKSDAPILPVGIKRTFELLPPGGKLKIKKIVGINVGKPLYFEKEREAAKNLGCDSEKYKEIIKNITDETMKEIAKLTGQNYSY